MITNIDIDIFKQPCDAMVHQCNCFHIMGGGIAARVKAVYPEAYAVDLETKYADKEKLGTYSVVQGKKDGKWIYNMYGQFGLDKSRNTNYEAYYTGLYLVGMSAFNKGLKSLSIPKNMGCTLGGGSWEICNVMIKEIFNIACLNTLDIFICNYDPNKTNNL